MIEASTGIKSVTPVSPATDKDREAKARAQAAEQPAEETAPSAAAEAVERTLKALIPPLMGENERLSILKDEATGLFIYRSVDKQTGEVVRQWPAESMLQFKAYLRQEGVGVAVDRLA